MDDITADAAADAPASPAGSLWGDDDDANNGGDDGASTVNAPMVALRPPPSPLALPGMPAFAEPWTDEHQILFDALTAAINMD